MHPAMHISRGNLHDFWDSAQNSSDPNGTITLTSAMDPGNILKEFNSILDSLISLNRRL